MLISEILTEQASGLLYHGTSWQNAVEIVNDGGFMPLSGHMINGKPARGLSTSRSPRISHLDYDPAKHSYDGPQISAFNVIFVLDRGHIASRYRIAAVDYYNGREAFSITDRDAAKLRDRRSEAEEFIVIPSREKLSLKGNVLKILYFPGSFSDPDDEPSTDDYLRFSQRALQYSLPVVYKKNLYDYGSYKRDMWRKDDRASMITHADKNEHTLPTWEYDQLMAMKTRYDAAGRPRDETAWTMFSPTEQLALVAFWQRLNARTARLGLVMPGSTVRTVFNILSKLDPKNPIAYRRISPFKPAVEPPKPMKHNGGTRKSA